MNDNDMDKLSRSMPAPWRPMTNLVDIKHIGKLGEELGECVSASMRCLIQGIDGVEPDTGKLNKHWLEDEIADVLANIYLVAKRFELDMAKIEKRHERKIAFLEIWHNRADEPSQEEIDKVERGE